MMHTAKYMHQILDLALPAFDELLGEVNVDSLIENNGILYVWNEQNLKSRELEIKIRNDLGVKQQVVNKEIHDLEPNLNLFIMEEFSMIMQDIEIQKILIKLFENFMSKGGKFLKFNINDLNFDEDKPVIRSESQRFIFDKLVIACGAFSKRLTDKLHEKFLDTERGYHVHFKGFDHLISRPIGYSNRGFGMTPMEQGLRVVGTVEFGGLEIQSQKQIKNLI